LKNRGPRRHFRRAALSRSPQARRIRRTILIRREHPNVLNTRLLRQIIYATLENLFGKANCELSFAILDTARMSGINKQYLNHEGPTDVITFDYSDTKLCGEILVCLDVAISQAREFETTWQAELVRYIVHGLLHLRGYEDHVVEARRKMKLEEDRVVEQLARSFEFGKL
jgi:rRNA maturation RNase YbeY